MLDLISPAPAPNPPEAEGLMMSLPARLASASAERAGKAGLSMVEGINDCP